MTSGCGAAPPSPRTPAFLVRPGFDEVDSLGLPHQSQGDGMGGISFPKQLTGNMRSHRQTGRQTNPPGMLWSEEAFVAVDDAASRTCVRVEAHEDPVKLIGEGGYAAEPAALRSRGRKEPWNPCPTLYSSPVRQALDQFLHRRTGRGLGLARMCHTASGPSMGRSGGSLSANRPGRPHPGSTEPDLMLRLQYELLGAPPE